MVFVSFFFVSVSMTSLIYADYIRNKIHICGTAVHYVKIFCSEIHSFNEMMCEYLYVEIVMLLEVDFPMLLPSVDIVSESS